MNEIGGAWMKMGCFLFGQPIKCDTFRVNNMVFWRTLENSRSLGTTYFEVTNPTFDSQRSLALHCIQTEILNSSVNRDKSFLSHNGKTKATSVCLLETRI